MAALESDLQPPELPDLFRRWFASRGWTPREHQLALLRKARDRRSALLIAPTGAGKTLAGFLPTLVELGGDAGQCVRLGEIPEELDQAVFTRSTSRR